MRSSNKDEFFASMTLYFSLDMKTYSVLSIVGH